MKKFAKMSLVAAIAVAGLTSTASAQPLAEAVKKVDVFGYVNIRYHESDTDGTHSSSYTHKTVLGATGKLNDVWSYTGAWTDFSVASTSGDYNAGFLMVYNYFTFTGLENTSINLGRQGLFSPLTVGYDPATATSEGNGVGVVSKLGDVTLSGYYFTNTAFGSATVDQKTVPTYGTISGDESYIQVGAAGKVAGVNLDVWYADMADAYDQVTVGASGSFMVGDVKLTPSIRYTTTDIEGSSDDQSLIKVGLGAKAGIFSASVAYAETDEEGGWVAFDNDAKASIKGWTTTINNVADASMIKATVGVDLNSEFNLSVTHAGIDKDATGAEDTDENFVTLKYKPSSNFSAYLRFAEVDYDGATEDKDLGRLNMLWLF